VRSPGRVDYVGATLLSAGMVGFLAGVGRARAWGWLAPPMLALEAAGLAMLVAFGAYELHRREPMVDVRTLASRPLRVRAPPRPPRPDS
jgi:hypothetical protein